MQKKPPGFPDGFFIDWTAQAAKVTSSYLWPIASFDAIASFEDIMASFEAIASFEDIMASFDAIAPSVAVMLSVAIASVPIAAFSSVTVAFSVVAAGVQAEIRSAAPAIIEPATTLEMSARI
ncbi:MAG: hypothetical protein WC803_10505 [Sphingomonas sp.]|jgi:hypothetical protein